jgi:hypothetical protein
MSRILARVTRIVFERVEYCIAMSGQDLSRTARLHIILLYKSYLFPFRHSSDYLAFGHLLTSTA